ncbi:hypothetical protein CERSUDRAFT_118343 [Gelatoporia subvermispora B]|uniref:Uncharacterized protein n=1 Tax=Ceriporiopsis subvermispora (strain B) TaxID=914234 RepID=M2PBG8_CERS8|nr:hypothetical protein CERSUDRAFT_118343 [Gelatoporia subvermispora B]
MHRALETNDILHHIFWALGHFPGDKGYLEARDPGVISTLACAVRVCKAWSDPALARLWARMNSLLPLLRILPNFGTRIEFRTTCI